MARKRRRPGWRGAYRGLPGGPFEVRTFRARGDGEPDGRFRPVSWGWWTPGEAQAVLNDPDRLVGLAADAPVYRAVLEALRLLAKEVT